ncbi:unnamed protein product [Brassica napus]|uniref:(rape) hypothetical protein n=1 Tax=Brassica napus TaxID=3708 RepID=A0A816IGL6_BRANA|nr:unnamed protein product [Brassica napus]
MIQAKLDDGKDLYVIGFGYFTAFMVVVLRYANIPYRHQPQHQDDDDGEGRTLHLKFGRSTTSRQMCRDRILRFLDPLHHITDDFTHKLIARSVFFHRTPPPPEPSPVGRLASTPHRFGLIDGPTALMVWRGIEWSSHMNSPRRIRNCLLRVRRLCSCKKQELLSFQIQQHFFCPLWVQEGPP